jgi:hypothetical protein
VDFEKRGWHEGDLSGYWEVDHVIQRNKGGVSPEENCLPACTRCNRLRWHRSGDNIRELILLGLVAQDEINKNSELGKSLVILREKRLLNNKSRRKHLEDWTTNKKTRTSRDLETDINALLERSDENAEPLQPSVFKNLEETIRHFEVTHPTLTEQVTAISDILSGAGI